MLMIAMKLCSAQLSHQEGAMTARPPAAKVCRTEIRKTGNAWHQISKCFPS